MRKIIVLVLVLLLLAACAAPAVEYDEPTTETTEYITTTEMPTTTEEPTTVEPREWPGVPQAYWAILDSYASHAPYASPAAAGFALVDINDDGVLELVIVDGNGGAYRLFTQRDDQAYSLAVRGGTVGFTIAQDGTVFGMGGTVTFTHSSNRLEPNATELTVISYIRLYPAAFPMLMFDEEGNVGRQLTEDEHNEIMQRYWTENPMQFNDITWFDEVAA
ncbi:MAG: hypothetical protein FWE40_02800 [Oscillospiraceae bacterium]|nr:hypothetical protein [Oscillospiraceae bacterium]